VWDPDSPSGGGPDFVIRPGRSVVDARLSFCSYAWGQCRS